MENFIKKFKFVIYIFLLILIGILGYKTYKYINLQKLINTPINKLTEEQKLEDFEYLYNIIIENYPFLEVNKRKYGIDWVDNKEKYIEFIKQEPNFKVALNEILLDLNNSHTNLLEREFIEYMIYAYESMEWQKMFLDILNNPLVKSRYELDIDNNLYFESNSKKMNIYKSNAVVQDVIKGKIASIYIPSMINYTDIEQDKKIITEYLNNIEDYQALIIDIRGNGGGDTRYWNTFLLPLILKERIEVTTYNFYKDGNLIKEFFNAINFKAPKIDNLNLSSFPNLPPEISSDFKYYGKSILGVSPNKNSIKFKGNIYLFVDNNVFSASEGLTIFAKESGFATVIGEQTKGDGIGSDPLIAMLPNSGYVFRFSKDMGVTSDGTCNEEYGTTPDYVVNSAKYPYEYINVDECVLKVLELEGIDTSELN